MTKINWKLRLKNKTTVSAAATVAVGIAAGAVQLGNTLGWWSIKFDSKVVTNEALSVINILFTIGGGFVGIVHDPTTAGVSDSAQALTYTEPKK